MGIFDFIKNNGSKIGNGIAKFVGGSVISNTAEGANLLGSTIGTAVAGTPGAVLGSALTNNVLLMSSKAVLDGAAAYHNSIGKVVKDNDKSVMHQKKSEAISDFSNKLGERIKENSNLMQCATRKIKSCEDIIKGTSKTYNDNQKNIGNQITKKPTGRKIDWLDSSADHNVTIRSPLKTSNF